MKTQNDHTQFFHFLGLKVPVRRHSPSDLARIPRAHTRYEYEYQYETEASEMMIWLESSNSPHTRYKTSIINSSLEGYCLILRNTSSTTLKVDDIVCLHAPTDDPNISERGRIRWLKQITPTNLGMGVHLIF
jgi:hypothetical protein